MTRAVFIDGEEGTTGLQIRDRLEGRAELELIHLPESQRKDPVARRDALNDADLAVLCLPDQASREAVAMIDNPKTRVIDASTAHRVSDGWVYGFPEMRPNQRSRIEAAKRVTNPGCYPTGAIALILPLVASGIVPPDYPVQINAVSGYSGGGKSLIARMEDPGNPDPVASAFFVYGLGLEHKHVPEIQHNSGLAHSPLFAPSVGRFRQGMIVQVPLQLWSLPEAPTVARIQQTLRDYYGSYKFVTVAGDADSAARASLLDPEELNDTNHLRLFVFGNERAQQVVLAAQLDNLGKGAAGQTVQNLNLMLGLAETAGLE
ncbi:MAG: N-acetyl-gamma-glutamyl-phosphate reductase [Proteobacteria bacterium]|nr:N-acetyl-gamma-glutamyl-phosphate reductase [Pseudomonadota bacterium]